MDSSEVDIVRKYGADTAEAMAHFMRGEFASGVQILMDLLTFLQSMPNGGDSGGNGNFPQNPEQHQLNEDGSFVTIQQWFTDAGFEAPTAPDGTPVPGDFIWAPNAPNQDHPDWATAEWVWRPPLV